MIRMMTKDEWYAAVAEAKDNGYTGEDCLNVVLNCVVEGTATFRELFKYAKWIGLTANKKYIRRLIKEEKAKRKLSKKNGDNC